MFGRIEGVRHHDNQTRPSNNNSSSGKLMGSKVVVITQFPQKNEEQTTLCSTYGTFFAKYIPALALIKGFDHFIYKQCVGNMESYLSYERIQGCRSFASIFTIPATVATASIAIGYILMKCCEKSNESHNSAEPDCERLNKLYKQLESLVNDEDWEKIKDGTEAIIFHFTNSLYKEIYRSDTNNTEILNTFKKLRQLIDNIKEPDHGRARRSLESNDRYDNLKSILHRLAYTAIVCSMTEGRVRKDPTYKLGRQLTEWLANDLAYSRSHGYSGDKIIQEAGYQYIHHAIRSYTKKLKTEEKIPNSTDPVRIIECLFEFTYDRALGNYCKVRDDNSAHLLSPQNG